LFMLACFLRAKHTPPAQNHPGGTSHLQRFTLLRSPKANRENFMLLELRNSPAKKVQQKNVLNIFSHTSFSCKRTLGKRPEVCSGLGTLKNHRKPLQTDRTPSFPDDDFKLPTRGMEERRIKPSILYRGPFVQSEADIPVCSCVTTSGLSPPAASSAPSRSVS